MSLKISALGAVTVARIEGELTIGVVDSLQDDLKGLLNYKHVQVDLSAVTEIDSCGCQALGLLVRAARERQRRLAVLPGNPLVDDALHLLGLARLVLLREE